MWVCTGIVAYLIATVVAGYFFDPIWRRQRVVTAKLSARESVSDEELFEQHFAPDEANPDIPGRVRRVFAECLGYPEDKLLPDDDLSFFDPELDFADVYFRLEKIFGIEITKTDHETVPCCTIRAITQLVSRKVVPGIPSSRDRTGASEPPSH